MTGRRFYCIALLFVYGPVHTDMPHAKRRIFNILKPNQTSNYRKDEWVRHGTSRPIPKEYLISMHKSLRIYNE